MTVVSDISINPKTINVSDIGKLEVQNRKPFQKEPSTCDADTTVDSFIVVENFEDPRQQDDLRKSRDYGIPPKKNRESTHRCVGRYE
jgi:hypothetical protein